jgi:secondary thiamine-phosphate synthase enzyme
MEIQMICHIQDLELQGSAGTDVFEVSAQVCQAVSDSGVQEGLVCVHTPGSTAAVTTIEYESGCLADLKQALERLAPSEAHYAHNARWGDGNGYSHLRAALLGPSLTVPVQGGTPVLGTWQQIVVCDFDNRPRRRRVVIQVQGV